MIDAFGIRNCQGPGKVSAAEGRLLCSAAKRRAVKGTPETAMPKPPTRRKNSRRDVLETESADDEAGKRMPQACHPGHVMQPRNLLFIPCLLPPARESCPL